jgi:plastocyanin
MRSTRLLALPLLAAFLAGPVTSPAAERSHCQPVVVAAVPGDPDAFRVTTPIASMIGRRPSPTRSTAGAALAVVRLFPASFDADGDTVGTLHDTLLVAPGTVVRWVRRGPGFHTVTSGQGSGDPNAGSEYNAIFDDQTTSFEYTFTTPGQHDFFCLIHEPAMMGSIVVTNATADAPGPGAIRRPTFTRAPFPNPGRGGTTFAIALPHAAVVRLSVHDVAGREVARLVDGALPAGEHPFRWEGRFDRGGLAPSGRYFVRFTTGDVLESRAVTLAR